jgi:flagellar biosynthesis/type III secretory pathway M-ring protein FliF/YscJ
MILIVGVVDIFFNFMQCPLHPEWSAPCSVIWINAAGYGFFSIIAIIFAIFSARKLRKIKKKIENEFFEATNQAGNKPEDRLEEPEKTEEKSGEIKEVKAVKPKRIIAKSDKKETPKKAVKKETKKETKKTAKSSAKEESTTKKRYTKK